MSCNFLKRKEIALTCTNKDGKAAITVISLSLSGVACAQFF